MNPPKRLSNQYFGIITPAYKEYQYSKEDV